MIRSFLADVRRYCGRPPTARGLLTAVARNYGLQALLVYRLGRALLRASHDWRLIVCTPLGWPIYGLGRAYVRYALGIRLDLTADIGPGLYIGHWGDIHLRSCILGRHCSIAQFTHIMPLADGAGPVIGERVWIGAHAKILGSFSIGSGSTVSAGAVVCRDVPAEALCLGAPARILARHYDNKKLLRSA